MKKNYTLNRFYSEAKALLEKHNCIDPECQTRVSFEIKGYDTLELKFCIVYEKMNQYLFFAVEDTAKETLRRFEKEILESQGKVLPIETVSVDLSDERFQYGDIE